jgi:hypothetical protein
MRILAGFISFLTLIVLISSHSGAQDKKEPAKAENKDVDKKDAEKADAKKDDDKGKKKETKKLEEKVVYGETYSGKLKRMDANYVRDFTIEVSVVDPVKVSQVNVWQANEMARISQIPPKEVQNRAQQLARFNVELARKRSTEIYSKKDLDVTALDNCKVRVENPPKRYDDKGNLKPYTQKELKDLKGNSKLPGYPSEFDHLAVGQAITVYLAKPKDQSKSSTSKRKIIDDEDAKPEAVMIVVNKEAPPQK